MYRDLAKSDEDRNWLQSHHLRYDMTVIPPRDLCGEWVKTKGHYHPATAVGTGYPEIYEVLSGRAHYLLQSRDLTDVVMIDARAGDHVVIPPGYGHITINPTRDQTLMMSNIVSTAFESEYADYETLRGAAYYELTSGKLQKNGNYPTVPPVRHVRPKSMDGTAGRKPIYHLIGNSEAAKYLNCPEEYLDLFRELLKD
jgi:glucose-6-phosphate isomerase